jgi:hypothetical protein
VSDRGLLAAKAELEAVAAILDELAAIVAEGEQSYRSSADRRARICYLWIVAGSRLKNYYGAMGVSRAIGEFTGPIGLRHRLAYSRPDDVDEDIVWRTSTDDLPRLQVTVRGAIRALGS